MLAVRMQWQRFCYLLCYSRCNLVLRRFCCLLISKYKSQAPLELSPPVPPPMPLLLAASICNMEELLPRPILDSRCEGP